MDDVAQQVFTTLARDAAKLTPHSVLTAWLHTATRNAAIDLICAEQRRRTHEPEAHLMHELLTGGSEMNAEWEGVGPALDIAMDELAAPDRAEFLFSAFAFCFSATADQNSVANGGRLSRAKALPLPVAAVSSFQSVMR